MKHDDRGLMESMRLGKEFLHRLSWRNPAKPLGLLCCFTAVWCSSLVSQVSVRLPDSKVAADSGIAIPVYVGDLTGKKVTSFELVVSCDTGVVRLTGIDQKGTLSEGLTMFANNRKSPYNPGNMKVVCASARPLSGAGVLVKVLAHVGKKGKTRLTLSNVVLNTGEPPVRIQNGSLSVMSRRVKKSASGQ